MAKERKVYRGGLVEGVSVPSVDFPQYKVMASGWANLNQKIDAINTFAVKGLDIEMEEKGKRYAAENPISVEQFYKANPTDKRNLVGKDNTTTFGKAIRATQINMLATDMAVRAQGDFNKLKLESNALLINGTPMTIDQYKERLNAIIDGYSDALLPVDVDAAHTANAKLSLTANSYFTSYSDSLIKDFKKKITNDTMLYGYDQLERVADIINKGIKQPLHDFDNEEIEVNVDVALDAEKIRLRKEMEARSVSLDDILKWEGEWDARVLEEKKSYINTNYIQTPENTKNMKSASAVNKEVQTENFGGNKIIQEIFKSLDPNDKLEFKKATQEWKNKIISSRKKDKEGLDLLIANEKDILLKKYYEAEKDNDADAVDDIIEEAYKIDQGLGNELYVLASKEKDEGKFFDEDKKNDLYFDLFNNKLTQEEIYDAVDNDQISKDTAIDLGSRLVTSRSTVYTKADQELRKLLSVPEPGAITPKFAETQRYREYIARSAELLKFYNDNPGVSGEEILTQARTLVDTQKTETMEKEEYQKSLDDITTEKGNYKLDSSEWKDYFRDFYNKDFYSVRFDFFNPTGKKIDQLIKELNELKLMTPGVRYIPGTEEPGELEIGGVVLDRAKEFKRPHNINNTQIDMLIEELEELKKYE
jgi:hypothetical protein